MLAKGSDPNQRDYYACTPLHGAAALGNQEAAELLIKAGAQPNMADRQAAPVSQFLHLTPQLNPTQPNSTQLNPTQPNSTQPNPTQLNPTQINSNELNTTHLISSHLKTCPVTDLWAKIKCAHT